MNPSKKGMFVENTFSVVQLQKQYRAGPPLTNATTANAIC